jgi:hypothetical protein
MKNKFSILGISLALLFVFTNCSDESIWTQANAPSKPVVEFQFLPSTARANSVYVTWNAAKDATGNYSVYIREVGKKQIFSAGNGSIITQLLLSDNFPTNMLTSEIDNDRFYCIVNVASQYQKSTNIQIGVRTNADSGMNSIPSSINWSNNFNFSYRP